jgi:4-amino-4-deoxy-L-arabinose transferase-like glycosyltransferase
LRRSGWVLLLIALVPFGLHLWTNAHDNFFRDELYYLATAQHLDFGYVEFPPFVALVAAFSRTLLGTSVVAMRLVPALAQVAIVFLTASMVAMLGGGLAAQALAAIAIALGGVFLGGSGLLSMDPFDQLWWALAAWVLVRLIKRQDPRWWMLFGLVIGVGLLTKLTIAFFLIALLLGLLLSPARKLLFNRWLVVGGLIALGVAWPYIAWQIRHGFPVVEDTGIYSSGKTYQATPLEFLIQQVTTMNPVALPLWLGGLYFLFFVKEGSPYRAFGWAYLFLYVFFMLQKAKFYWLSPAYPMLFAAGAYGLQLLVQQRPRLGWLQPTAIALLGLAGLVSVPFAIPILSPEAFVGLNVSTGGAAVVKQENLVSSDLPQNYADRYGWTEMVGAIKQAYDTLTPAEKVEACILTKNYGEAGAVDFYGAALGLPKAISGHNSYYLWGPQGCSGKVIISIGRPLQDLAGNFDSVEAGPAWQCDHCMPYENGAPIFIGRGLKAPMQAAWPTVKDYN